MLVRAVDTPGMIDLELELVRENASWIAVLKAYQVAQEELAARQAEAARQSVQTDKSSATDTDERPTENPDDKATDAEDDTSPSDTDDRSSGKQRTPRWVPRITRVQGIETDELSKIHGRLIAYDLIKCDLAGRTDGMVYQLTHTGKTIIARLDDETASAAA